MLGHVHDTQGEVESDPFGMSTLLVKWQPDQKWRKQLETAVPVGER